MPTIQDLFAPGELDELKKPKDPNGIDDIIENAGKDTGVDPKLIRSVMGQESGGSATAVSPKGARGLLQLMPATARSVGVENPDDPTQNIYGGARLLSKLLKKYNGDKSLALAAYHAGEGAVDAAGGIPNTNDGLIDTKDYVKDILSKYDSGAQNPIAEPKKPATLPKLEDLFSKDELGGLALTKKAEPEKPEPVVASAPTPKPAIAPKPDLKPEPKKPEVPDLGLPQVGQEMIKPVAAVSETTAQPGVPETPKPVQPIGYQPPRAGEVVGTGEAVGMAGVKDAAKSMLGQVKAGIRVATKLPEMVETELPAMIAKAVVDDPQKKQELENSVEKARKEADDAYKYYVNNAGIPGGPTIPEMDKNLQLTPGEQRGLDAGGPAAKFFAEGLSLFLQLPTFVVGGGPGRALIQGAIEKYGVAAFEKNLPTLVKILTAKGAIGAAENVASNASAMGINTAASEYGAGKSGAEALGSGFKSAGIGTVAGLGGEIVKPIASVVRSPVGRELAETGAGYAGSATTFAGMTAMDENSKPADIFKAGLKGLMMHGLNNLTTSVTGLVGGTRPENVRSATNQILYDHLKAGGTFKDDATGETFSFQTAQKDNPVTDWFQKLGALNAFETWSRGRQGISIEAPGEAPAGTQQEPGQAPAQPQLTAEGTQTPGAQAAGEAPAPAAQPFKPKTLREAMTGRPETPESQPAAAKPPEMAPEATAKQPPATIPEAQQTQPVEGQQAQAQIPPEVAQIQPPTIERNDANVEKNQGQKSQETEASVNSLDRNDAEKPVAAAEKPAPQSLPDESTTTITLDRMNQATKAAKKIGNIFFDGASASPIPGKPYLFYYTPISGKIKTTFTSFDPSPEAVAKAYSAAIERFKKTGQTEAPPADVIPPDIANQQVDMLAKYHESQGLSPDAAKAQAQEDFDMLPNSAKVQFKELQSQKNAAQLSAWTDPGTGLNNRQWGETHGDVDEKGNLIAPYIDKEGHIAPRDMMIIDIDNFGKGVNDSHGHAVGDDVLRKTAYVLTKNLRGKASVMRFGGEEIAIFPLKGVPTEDILKAQEAARKELAKQEFNDGKLKGVTFSGGFGHTFKEADKNLYNAKAEGKARTFIDGEKYGTSEQLPPTKIGETNTKPAGDISGTAGAGGGVSAEAEAIKPAEGVQPDANRPEIQPEPVAAPQAPTPAESGAPVRPAAEKAVKPAPEAPINLSKAEQKKVWEKEPWWNGSDRPLDKPDSNSTKNEYHFRLIHPDKFDKEAMRTKNGKADFVYRDSWNGLKAPGIRFVVGKINGKEALQTLRIDKTKRSWDAARQWISANASELGRPGLKEKQEPMKVPAEEPTQMTPTGIVNVPQPYIKDSPIVSAHDLYRTQARFNDAYIAMDPAQKRDALANERARLRAYLDDMKKTKIDPGEEIRIEGLIRALGEETRTINSQHNVAGQEKTGRENNQVDEYVKNAEATTNLQRAIEKDVKDILDATTASEMHKFIDGKYDKNKVEQAIKDILQGRKDGRPAEEIRKKIVKLLRTGRNHLEVIDAIKEDAGTLEKPEGEAGSKEKPVPFQKPRTDEQAYYDATKKQTDLFEGTENADKRTPEQRALDAVVRQREEAKKAKEKGVEGLPMFEGAKAPEAEQTSLFQKPGDKAKVEVLEHANSADQVNAALDRLPQWAQGKIRVNMVDSFDHNGETYQLGKDRTASILVHRDGSADVYLWSGLTDAQKASALAHEIPGHYGSNLLFEANKETYGRMRNFWKAYQGSRGYGELADAYHEETTGLSKSDKDRYLFKEWVADNIDKYLSGKEKAGVAQRIYNWVKDILVKLRFKKDSLDDVLRAMVKEMGRVGEPEGQKKQGPKFQQTESEKTPAEGLPMFKKPQPTAADREPLNNRISELEKAIEDARKNDDQKTIRESIDEISALRKQLNKLPMPRREVEGSRAGGSPAGITDKPGSNYGFEEEPMFKKNREAKPGETAGEEDKKEPGLIGRTIKSINDLAASTAEKAKSAYKEITDIGGTYSPFKKALNEFVGATQKTAYNVNQGVHFITNEVGNASHRAAISVWREAGGDAKLLKEWADKTPDPKLRQKYELAQSLTDKEKGVAKQITRAYADMLERGKEYGLIENAVKNYVNHIIDKADEKPNGYTAKLTSSGKLSNTFRSGKERVFPTIFDAEQAGYKVKTADAAPLMGVYISEMDKVINTHNLVKAMMNAQAKDGRPLAVVEGEAGTDEGMTVKKAMNLIDDIEARPAGYYGDYRGMTHYALHNWVQRGTKDDLTPVEMANSNQEELFPENKKGGNSAGKEPVYLKGDIAFHPDVYKHMKAMLGEDKITEMMNNPQSVYTAVPLAMLKLIDKAQALTKKNMFRLSGFHWVQEGTHGVWHATNPFNVKPVDLTKAEDAQWADHGLMIYADHESMNRFQEGLSSGGSALGELAKKVPKLGELMKQTGTDNLSDLLFKYYIPALKLKTAKNIYQRNMDLYKKDIKAGRVTEDDVMYLSAQQANAAYGHLNYTDIGRSKTMQHLMRWALLAPDFLEARARFAGQSMKVLIGGKNGVEQAKAMARNIILLGGGCAVINALINNGNTHIDDHPFSVVYKNRVYHLRSVAGDIAHLKERRRQFILGRISPVISKSASRIFTQSDYRGAPQTTFDYIKEILTAWVPISIRGMIPLIGGNKDLNAWDMFMSAMGVGVSRYAPMTQIYEKLDDWKKKVGIKPDPTVYPPSKFRDLRNYIQDGNAEMVKSEWEKLQLETGERSSVLYKKFVRGTMKSFSNTKENDLLFKKSLSKDDQKMFEAAVADKGRMLQNFKRLLLAPETETEKTIRSIHSRIDRLTIMINRAAGQGETNKRAVLKKQIEALKERLQKEKEEDDRQNSEGSDMASETSSETGD